jgi:hypothetical protein
VIFSTKKVLWENTLWIERFPQEVLFRLKAILQDNGTRVPSPLAYEGRGQGERSMYIMSEKYSSV